MKIIDTEDPLKRVLDVYAFYWVDGRRSHLVIPYEGFEGLIVVSENKCDVVDPSVDGFILKKSYSGYDMFVNWAAEQGNLLDRLIDPPAPEAVSELLRRIAENSRYR